MSTCGSDRAPTKDHMEWTCRKVTPCEMQAMEVGEQALKGDLSFPGMTLCSSASTPLSIHGHTHARDQQKAPMDLFGEHEVPGTHCYQMDREAQTTGAKRRQDTELDAYQPDSPRPKCYMEIHTAPT